MSGGRVTARDQLAGKIGELVDAFVFLDVDDAKACATEMRVRFEGIANVKRCVRGVRADRCEILVHVVTVRRKPEVPEVQS